IPGLAKALSERYAVLDRLLEGRAFLLGDRLSMADIVNGATLYRYYEMEIERPALPRLAAWYERLKERPAYRKGVMVSFEELRGR
ncbi:MAG TPA: glutathione binding-like protein, partial [Dongiaceae bacterium]